MASIGRRRCSGNESRSDAGLSAYQRQCKNPLSVNPGGMERSRSRVRGQPLLVGVLTSSSVCCSWAAAWPWRPWLPGLPGWPASRRAWRRSGTRRRSPARPRPRRCRARIHLDVVPYERRIPGPVNTTCPVAARHPPGCRLSRSNRVACRRGGIRVGLARAAIRGRYTGPEKGHRDCRRAAYQER